MTLNERTKLEASTRAERAISRGADGAAGRRDDLGRDCKDCGATFAPTYGERYCPECVKGKGW